MNTRLAPDEFLLFQNLIEKECGLVLGQEKGYLIEHRLAPLLRETGCSSYRDFYLLARQARDRALQEKIIDALTTSETLWFRDEWPFTALREKLLPAWVEALEKGERSRIRIWSAGCATGQEPYSVRMTLLEYARTLVKPMLTDRVEILATDISNGSLAKARAGCFHKVDTDRGLPQHLRDRYFNRKGQDYQLGEEVRQGIEFRQHNLQDSFVGFGLFDLILLRNVAIYFSPQFKEALCGRMLQALRPTGCFFLGSTESLTGIRHQFTRKVEGRIVFYFRPSGPCG